MSPRSIELGPLEMKVLGLLEDCEAASVTTLQSALKKSGDDLAYTTVMTVLVRLHGKGYLERRKEGRQFLYYAPKKQQTSSKLLEKVRKTLFRDQRLKPILALLEEDDNLSADELKELRRAVDEKLKKAGTK